MRILVVSNFYPPHGLGGQEQSCLEVVEELRARGHLVTVLTSMHGVNGAKQQEAGVLRLLHLEMDLVPLRNALTAFLAGESREKHNHDCFLRVHQSMQPDIVFIWGMWNLPRSLPALIEATASGRVVYRFADYWPTLPSQLENYWLAPARHPIVGLPKRVLSSIALARLRRARPCSLKFEHAMCVSEATRQTLINAGLPLAHARVIRSGVGSLFLNAGSIQQVRGGRERMRLLYAGRLSPEKGIETALDAMSRLAQATGGERLDLTIAGSGSPSYEHRLRVSTGRMGLDGLVRFAGTVARQEMPQFLSQFDALLFPSVWPEPLPRVILEAMYCGVVVIGARTGGVAEIIRDAETGLLFQPGDGEELARRVLQLLENPDLGRKLAKSAREVARRDFTLAATIDRIERFLEEVRTGVGAEAAQAPA